PVAAHRAEQLALFDAAHIGTLHAFCFKLVREHCLDLSLDPQLSVADEGQAHLLAAETLNQLFESCYERDDPFSAAVRELIVARGAGRDDPIRDLLLRIHHFLQTRPDPDRWLKRQIEECANAEPVQWRQKYPQAIAKWRLEWTPVLQNPEQDNPKAAECLAILKSPAADQSVLAQIRAADSNWPHGTKKFRKPLEEFFDDAAFLHSLAPSGRGDPLVQDWDCVRGRVKTLLELAREFERRFSTRKRAESLLDFHDLEQFSLKLLWDFSSESPTSVAHQWRRKFRFIFVDEYQDINAAQDKIISALSRNDTSADGPPGNRFLVGDVKQSIFRFRLADPTIFRAYARQWNGATGQTIPLAENFRSRPALLSFINSLFEPLMRAELGGVDYGPDARLQFGSPQTRPTLIADPGPRAEWLLHFAKRSGTDSSGEGNDDVADLDNLEKEARMLALRLRELKDARDEIWDNHTRSFRPADWRDMAVLLRAPASTAAVFCRQFECAGVPLAVERGGFYQNPEITDLFSLLQLLDNPLQDVPLIAVLRSPLAGFSLDELAQIRLLRAGCFWFALSESRRPGAHLPGAARARAVKFLDSLARWRALAARVSPGQCLEEILQETRYADWLRSRPDGTRRHANVGRFQALLERFSGAPGGNRIPDFLKFVETAGEPEVALVASENAVRLMSIHQAKGLEFPIVAVAGLARRFNIRDLTQDIIFDENLGLCSRVNLPGVPASYPSLGLWQARKNQRRELIGEELRLLYVAVTRARDRLLLTAGISEKKWRTAFENRPVISIRDILTANSCADWLVLWAATQKPLNGATETVEGQWPHLRWRIIGDHALSANPPPTVATYPPLPPLPEKLPRILAWKYPFIAATQRPAKSSVTALRHQARQTDDGNESVALFPPPAIPAAVGAAVVGVAHHKFLQHFHFAADLNLKFLKSEASRLQTADILSPEESRSLNLENILAFWNSALGGDIRLQPHCVRRELPFTAKFLPRELDEIFGMPAFPDLNDEFIVVQGVADLVVLLPNAIHLLDFKTDAVSAAALPEKIRFYTPQLNLYAAALQRIYCRPVTRCSLHFFAARRTVELESQRPSIAVYRRDQKSSKHDPANRMAPP
ncbi:MAG: UvrD-helicase domain-containing protein, partial [Verrucomicrobia bacterium]|nr:UvrD-helicase domain-containing protein [Verrucomicrobiota bacterium]